jgi:long-subunit acyl-CoA synthetase (AMP-forming)
MPEPRQLSHIYFTSGSTGKPKGCMATHANLAHFAMAKNSTHGITEGDVVFVASSHTFDPSLGDLMSTW